MKKDKKEIIPDDECVYLLQDDTKPQIKQEPFIAEEIARMEKHLAEEHGIYL